MRRFSGDKPEKKRPTGKGTVGKPEKEHFGSSGSRYGDKSRKEKSDKPWKSEHSDAKPWKKRDGDSDAPKWRSSHRSDDNTGFERNKSGDRLWRGTKDTTEKPWREKRDSGKKSWREEKDSHGKSSWEKKDSSEKKWQDRRESSSKSWDDKHHDDKPRRSFRNERSDEDKPWKSRKPSNDKPWQSKDDERKTGWASKRDSDEKPWREKKYSEKDRKAGQDKEDKPWKSRSDRDEKGRGFGYDKPRKSKKEFSRAKKSDSTGDGLIRLNKYIANAGISSRREADEMIAAGAIKVNGVIVTELGTKVGPNDKVQIGDETLNPQKKVYLLLNKPKGYITTVDDPQERNTVMMLVKDACRERIYPVGRLDRNTSGLLLMTNDGELAKKLTHPSHKVRKIYHVELNKAFSKSDMIRMTEGIELEDGIMAVDEIAYTGKGDDKKNLGVAIHSGKNRVVRRLFEALDYEVVKLDRVVFANLTKKDLPRGRWRFLEESEINMLMMI